MRRGPRYFEVDIDVGSSSTANHVVGMVQGALKGLVIDMAVLLEGHLTVGLWTHIMVGLLLVSGILARNATLTGKVRKDCCLVYLPGGLPHECK
jgi:Protein ENHANCED DISEASE RESISTANCE 2, C-terminal